MPEWIKWFFDGLGTELLSLIIGAIFGGMVGFRIGKHKRRFVQRQEGGSESEQYQKGSSQHKKHDTDKDTTAYFTQKQTAGDKSKQIQIGEQKDV